MVANRVIGARRSGLRVSQTAADLLGFPQHHNHLSGSQRRKYPAKGSFVEGNASSVSGVRGQNWQLIVLKTSETQKEFRFQPLLPTKLCRMASLNAQQCYWQGVPSKVAGEFLCSKCRRTNKHVLKCLSGQNQC